MEHFYQNIDGWSTEPDQGQLLKTILTLTSTKEKIKSGITRPNKNARSKHSS